VGKFFSSINFFISNEHYLISKLERILILIITRRKGVEIGKVHFANTFHDYYGSNVLLDLKIMNFEYVISKKLIQFYVIKMMHA
jgi:hypothetical protein